MRFNPPPNWPVESGWTPAIGWQPPAEWDEPPYGWQLWISDDPQSATPVEDPPAQPDSTQRLTETSEGEQPVEPPAEPPPGPPDEADPQENSQHKPTKRLWAKAVENPLWTTFGAIVGIIGLVLSMVQIVQAMKTPPVDLEVAALTLDNQQSIQGIVTGGNADGNRTIDLTPIDLTLQNKGGEPSLITRIDAEVVYFEQLRDCTFAESVPEAIVSKYDLAIPMNNSEPAQKQLSSEIRFEVKAGTADRMVLTLGPQTQPLFETTPMVISARIKLIHDGEQVMDVGTVSVVTTVGAAVAQIDALASATSPETQNCATQNLERLDEMFAIQATRSHVLDGLRSAYQRASA